VHDQLVAQTVQKLVAEESDCGQEGEALPRYTEKKSLRKLCFYLVGKIQDPNVQRLFQHCIPVMKLDYDVLELLLPYVIYYALRYNSDPKLPHQLQQYFCDILDSVYSSHIQTTLIALDFLKICLE